MLKYLFKIHMGIMLFSRPMNVTNTSNVRWLLNEYLVK